MPDFQQIGPVTTLHELGTVHPDELEELLVQVTRQHKLGLVLPITASDMRAPAFLGIVQKLAGQQFLEDIVVVLNRAPSVDDYRQCREVIAPLGEAAHVLWTDGPRGMELLQRLHNAGFSVDIPGKGRAVWCGFGYLLARPEIKGFVLHDCDIVNYDREMLVRLCLPMAHPGLDFEFCKAYYARCTDRMHGRLVRLLVTPILRALLPLTEGDEFVEFLQGFRYSLAGEFAVTSTLARSNRMPSDWGIEVGILAEVFRNTSPKRVCQVDLGRPYEHKHQQLNRDNPEKGLMKMAQDVLVSIFRTLASRGLVFNPGHFVTLRAAYLRMAQDAIRQYYADAIMNSLAFDRHAEEEAVEALAGQITQVGKLFHEQPATSAEMPTWARVLSAMPDFPNELRKSVLADATEHAPANAS